MDEETIKKEGTKPLKEMLTEISDMFTKSDTEFDTLSKDSSTLSETVLFLQKLGVSALVSTGAGADDTDPDTVVVQVSSPWRIGLPAKDYYKDKDVVAKYEAAFMAVLGALYPDSEVGKAEGLLEFEKRLAAASPDAEDQNDVTVGLHVSTFPRFHCVSWCERG
jgi:endothelin-converting enzyme